MLKKYIVIPILCIAILAIYLINGIFLQKSIAKKVVRLHIIANSNSAFDQNLKLQVRDKIVEYLAPKLINSNSIEESKIIIADNTENIKQITKEITSQYSDYEINVSLGSSKFPTKSYENYSFPAGTYDALKITIGEGAGNNWWCVMFPPLCFTNSSIGAFSKESEELLESSLSKEELNTIKHSEKPEVQIKFKFLEWWNSK
ncbi:MAG: stage II sporulation protein R [Clostridia bacterium]|nr:stage II sporulation protein R [Clostridia bacterium]